MGIQIINPVTGGSIDLTAPPTNIGTTTPPAITVSTLFRSANSGNVPFVAQPSGTGAFQLQPTDSTVTGGNARGANAVDLQTSRSAANQVVSGANSFAAGRNNIVSGAQSGAIGDGNTCSGVNSFAFGGVCTATQNYTFAGGIFANATDTGAFAWGFNANASGLYSFALGSCPNTKSVYGLFALGSRLVGVTGKAQATILSLTGATTDATPLVLRSAAEVAASANNQLVLQNNSAITFFGLAVATITGGGDTACWKVEGGIKRGANAASTALVGTPTITSISADAGAAAWTLALTANTTNGCLAATATNGAGVTVRVNLSLFASEVAF